MTEIKNIETSQGTVQVKMAGTGTPLLLVHGLFSSMDTFLPLFDDLLAGRQLIAIDFPGHGASSVGRGFVASWQGHADVIKSVVDALALDTFDVCGHSMGGGVAAMLAGQMPERVERLALIDSVTARFRLPLKGRIPQVPLLGDLVFKVLYGEKMFFSYFRNDVFLDATKLNTERIRGYYRSFSKNRDVILRAVRATADPSPVIESLTNVEADTLVIWGRQDPLIPFYVGNETVRKIKRASLQIIDDCGHSPIEECPDKTISLLADFFK
jgi:pimeloyl-ACP methyl ester carboxylesterase